MGWLIIIHADSYVASVVGNTEKTVLGQKLTVVWGAAQCPSTTNCDFNHIQL
jgi:hypothetical protein